MKPEKAELGYNPATPVGRDPARWSRVAWAAPTVAVFLLALVAVWIAWNVWLGTPWTRDARVRVYVVSMAPEVAGRVTELRVHDNQFVHKGDVLMVIDPVDYVIAVSDAQAAVDMAAADLSNKLSETQRRAQLTTLSTSNEEKQRYLASAAMATGALGRARANLARARVNLERTEMRASVNGWVTNLRTRIGDFASVGIDDLAVVDADSFWIDAYFEETALAHIHDGDVARIDLMGYPAELRGHVDSVAHGIEVPNAQPDTAGLASVDPIFTWIRLAQRIPVRVELDHVPNDVNLVAGQTATVRILPKRQDLNRRIPR